MYMCINIYIYIRPIAIATRGGGRYIVLTNMAVRIWGRGRRPYMQKWIRKHSGIWDAALSGSSALREAV